MFMNVRQRPHTVGWFVGADARTSVPTVRGGLLHALHIIRLFLLARPAQGAATTTDVDLRLSADRMFDYGLSTNRILEDCALGVHIKRTPETALLLLVLMHHLSPRT